MSVKEMAIIGYIIICGMIIIVMIVFIKEHKKLFSWAVGSLLKLGLVILPILVIASTDGPAYGWNEISQELNLYEYNLEAVIPEKRELNADANLEIDTKGKNFGEDLKKSPAKVSKLFRLNVKFSIKSA